MIESTFYEHDKEYFAAALEAILFACSTPVEKSKLCEILQIEAEELELLAMAEAEGEGPDGQWLVMSVVMNRVDDPEWPDSISEVINQYMTTKTGKKVYQFSSIADGRIAKVRRSEDSSKALERIRAGDIAPEVVAFEVEGTDILDKWFMYAFTFKNHKFYTKKGE